MRLSRRDFVIAAAGAPAFAAGDRPLDLFARMATALAGGDAAAFMRPIDRAMPRYAELRRNVEALVAVEPPASSVEVIDESGDDRARTVRLDWVLEVAGQRRESELTCRVEHRGNKWTVVALAPIEFFRPAQR